MIYQSPYTTRLFAKGFLTPCVCLFRKRKAILSKLTVKEKAEIIRLDLFIVGNDVRAFVERIVENHFADIVAVFDDFFVGNRCDFVACRRF